jgi:hypothetical protein
MYYGPRARGYIQLLYILMAPKVIRALIQRISAHWKDFISILAAAKSRLCWFKGFLLPNCTVFLRCDYFYSEAKSGFFIF